MRAFKAFFAPNFLIKHYSRKVLSGKYSSISKSIEMARLAITPQELLASSFFYALITFLSISLVQLLFFVVFKGRVFNASSSIGLKFLEFLTNVAIRTKLSFLENVAITLYSFGNLRVGFTIILLFCLFFSMFFAGFVRFLILSYPDIVSSKRKGEIDLYLPYAINMMHGMASGGISAYEIVKAIAEAKFMFKELSKEFETIVNLVEFFDEDLISAMDYVKETTPSEKLSSLLEDIIFVLKGGGKLSAYFSGKSKEVLQREELSYSSYLEFLSLMTETYLSVFILFPLFLLIILVVMKITGENLLKAYVYVLYAVLPISTAIFVYLIKSSMPVAPASYERIYIGEEKIKVKIGDVEPGLRFKKFRGILKKFVRFMKSPLEKEIYTLELKVVILYIAIFSSTVTYLSYKFLPSILIPVSISSFALPLIIFIEIRNKKIRKIESKIPEMFKELALLNEAGLTIIESIKILSRLDFGELTRELRVIKGRMEWGESVAKAFTALEERVKSDIVAKIIPISVKVLEVSPSFKDAFNTVSQFAEAEVMLRERIRSGMLLYVIIIYMSVLVFLVVVYVLIHNMFSSFHASSQALGIYMNTPFLKKIFYYISLLVSFFSGIIAGVISSGKVSSGFKHSYVFLMLTYIMFNYLL